MSAAHTHGSEPLRLIKVMRRFRDLHPETTLTQAMIFLFIAAKAGTTQHDVWKSLELSDSVVSRSLGALTDIGVRGRVPLKLVKAEVGEDRRERILTLTPKGKQFMEDIMRDLGRS